jgi:hypothetical protein
MQIMSADSDTGSPSPAPRRRFEPLRDHLGEPCVAGREDAADLRQVPGGEGIRRKIAATAAEIKGEAATQGRREMGRIVDERLRQTSKSGLF